MNVDELAEQIKSRMNSCDLTDRDVLGSLVQESDRGQPWVEGANNYTWWYQIGCVRQPRKIVEIGTRFGYSLKALMVGGARMSTVLYVVDDERDADVEPLAVMERHFRNWDADIGRLMDLVIRRTDSQKLPSLVPTNCYVGSGFDLGSVDANHSVDGCYHDCGLVWEVLMPGGLMVVDDTLPGPVQEGCERFCCERGVSWAFLPTLRGVHLVLKPGLV